MPLKVGEAIDTAIEVVLGFAILIIIIIVVFGFVVGFLAPTVPSGSLYANTVTNISTLFSTVLAVMASPIFYIGLAVVIIVFAAVAIAYIRTAARNAGRGGGNFQ